MCQVVVVQVEAARKDIETCPPAWKRLEGSAAQQKYSRFYPCIALIGWSDMRRFSSKYSGHIKEETIYGLSWIMVSLSPLAT